MIWRGLNLDLRSEYPPKKPIVWWPITSCTSSIRTLDTPQYLDPTKPRTLFSIETHAGRSIRNHSSIPEEEEILLAPGHGLAVVGYLMQGNGACIIHLNDSKPAFITLVKPFPTAHGRSNSANERDLQFLGQIGIIAEKLRQKVGQDRGERTFSGSNPSPNR